MKISELIKNLQKVQEEYGDLDCIASSDDEGNEFSLIAFEPTVRFFDKGRYNSGEFTSEENWKEEPEEYDEDIAVNAVCVN